MAEKSSEEKNRGMETTTEKPSPVSIAGVGGAALSWAVVAKAKHNIDKTIIVKTLEAKLAIFLQNVEKEKWRIWLIWA